MQALNAKLDGDSVITFESTALKPADGWTGRVALCDSAGNSFQPDHWQECLSDPDSLADGSEVLKADGPVTVVLKKLNISDKTISVVIKTCLTEPGLKNLCRSLLPAKALRNFKTAAKLCTNGIPTAWPLAALQRKNGMFTTSSIYITEYIPESTDLYHFARNWTAQDNFTVKKNLCFQVARIFALMHKASLWHRDAKGGNFLVAGLPEAAETGRYKITLVDMDGIKPYIFRCSTRRFRGLYKLASTLLCHPTISLTDYWRTFTIYCDLTGLAIDGQRNIFHNITCKTVAVRLLTMVKAAIGQNKK